MASHSHHHHEHHHHEIDVVRAGHTLIVGIVLNVLFVIVEVIMGWRYNSLGLLSDAGHNVGDVFSLIMALLAYRLARVQASKRFTYGFRKSTVLVSLLNAIVLLIAVGAIVVESVRKLQSPVQVDGAAVTWTAALGIVVNGITAYMLMNTSRNDLNMRGAFLHMAADTLVSVGVLLSGIAISLWGITIIDSIVSLVIAVVILVSTWRLLADSLCLSLDGVPSHINVDEVAHAITQVEGVIELHHLHIWAMSTTQNALTAHVVIDDIRCMESVKRSVKAQLATLGISHATIEVEEREASCSEHDCTCGEG